jgi:Zn-dependent protease
MTSDFPALAGQFLLTICLAITAIILHELAHGYAAWALGDQTARRAGRLSLNPIRHVDRFGTLLLPGFLLLSQLLTVGRVLFMFGWAKPVPVEPRYFRYPRQMMAVVAIAGPLMNFCLAYLAALMLHVLPSVPVIENAAAAFIVLNLVLGIFNLMPIPPLDGGRIMVGILPLPAALVWAKLERFGILIVLVLIAGPSLLREAGIHVDPLGSVLQPAVGWAFEHILLLAGINPDAADIQ